MAQIFLTKTQMVIEKAEYAELCKKAAAYDAQNEASEPEPEQPSPFTE